MLPVLLTQILAYWLLYYEPMNWGVLGDYKLQFPLKELPLQKDEERQLIGLNSSKDYYNKLEEKLCTSAVSHSSWFLVMLICDDEIQGHLKSRAYFDYLSMKLFAM